MEVISKESEEYKKFFKEWFKEFFNIKGEIEDVKIYFHNKKIFEISFKDNE